MPQQSRVAFYQLSFRSRIFLRALASLFALLSCCVLEVRALAGWVAFNDHAAGTGTHVNATRWNAFNTAGGAPGSSGFLKNIVSGANLPVTLAITTNAGVTLAGTQGAAATGTPAYSLFNGFVDFQGTPNPAVELDGPDLVTYTFTGLNPANRYRFAGTAIRGNAPYVDHWTLIELQNALSFTAAHTAHALTSNQVPTLTPAQVAINTGVNNDSNSGDYASWDNIQPSAGGVIAITSRHYTGTVPGGSSAGARGYAITGIRLEELSAGATPVQIVSQPQSQTVAVGASATLSVVVSGTSPRYQWFKNGNPLADKTNQTLTFNPVSLADSGVYYVNITNSVSSTNSTNVTLTPFIAPIIYTNIGLTNFVWKYNQAGSEPPAISGLTWKDPEYNDSAWLSGRGILAFETGNSYVVARTSTVLSLTDSGGSPIVTYYFRTHFTLTNKPASVTMSLSNIIDDGAVVYLNGTEVERFNMPNGTVAYGIFASAAAIEGVFTWTNLQTSLLVQGTNTLAVEVHQNTIPSSDIVFGLIGLVVIAPPTQLTITSQPQDVAVKEGDAFALSVGVSGTQQDFQWFKDGVAISSANSSTFNIPAASPADAGVYLVVVTNALSSVVSDPVRVFVNHVTVGPALIEANGETTPVTIRLSFDQLLLANTATNVENYQVTNTFGELLSVVNATMTNGTNVILQTSVRRTDANYIVVVNNVAGLASNHATVLPDTSAPVRTRVLLIALQDTWDFFDPYPPIDDPDPGPMWNALGYDVTTWGWGEGAFHWGNTAVPVSVNTTLSPSPALTAYFRFPFESIFSPSGIRVEMQTLVDDGAVFYLNGQEFFRTNIPPGPVNYNTPASGVGNLSWPTTPMILEPNTFVGGENLFAVELHQKAANDEKTFAMEMVASVESLVTGPVVLTGGPRDLTVMEGAPARFAASGAGAAWFQWQLDGTNISSATNAALVFANAPLALDGHPFRVLSGNAQNSVWSTNATLHVLPDRQAPLLLSALASSNDLRSIVLTFSRALSVESASNLANYEITNASGASLSVTNAMLVNGTSVVLMFAQPLAGNYFVAVNHLRDTTTFGNDTAPGTRASIGASYLIPIDAAWKYLLINTNADVQAAFAGVSYDDSSWAGPSNALLYVEGATLPAPKNTLLSLTDISGNVFNTFYFRKRLVAAVGASDLTLHIRHIIDDGLVLHLNGTEIYRFNMPSGQPSAGTQALSPSIGDAALLGPFDLPGCTLLAGNNILAAEVHQNGAFSSDIVFGVEISGSIPSVVFTPANSLSLKISRWGNQAILSWNSSAVLESATSLTEPWMPVSGAASPFFISTDGAAAFYRLRE